MAQLVKALCHEPESRGFDSRIFYWSNPSGRTMALVSTQPLTYTSTRNTSWGEGVGLRQPVLTADNLTTFICRLSGDLVVSPSWNHRVKSRPVWE